MLATGAIEFYTDQLLSATAAPFVSDCCAFCQLMSADTAPCMQGLGGFAKSVMWGYTLDGCFEKQQKQSCQLYLLGQPVGTRCPCTLVPGPRSCGTCQFVSQVGLTC